MCNMKAIFDIQSGNKLGVEILLGRHGKQKVKAFRWLPKLRTADWDYYSGIYSNKEMHQEEFMR